MNRAQKHPSPALGDVSRGGGHFLYPLLSVRTAAVRLPYLWPMRLVRPSRRLGQCFLKDDALARKIARALRPAAPSVIEVGGGGGMLTRALQATYPDKTLWVVEVDPYWAEKLRRAHPDVQVLHQDFLQWAFEADVPAPVSVVGNFPYSISGPLVVHVMQRATYVPSWGGMWQREVARRLTARPGGRDYGILSVLVGAFYQRTYLFDVPPTAFSPQPKVWSAVTRFERKSRLPAVTPDHLLRVIKVGFRHRRKKLKNNIPAAWLPVFAELGIDQLRAEAVDIATWIRAAERLANLQHRP